MMDELLDYIAKLQEENDRFKERHNPKCECEWGPAVDSTLSRIRDFINQELKPKPAAEVARAFHETYERLAPEHGYQTRKASAVEWENVPPNNKSLMIAVVQKLKSDGVIS